MATNNDIKCILCDKVVGKYVLDGILDGGCIGSIPMYHEEVDYRKAAHCIWKENKRQGRLCRKCAKTKFPEGKSYTVRFMYHGKDTAICSKHPNSVFLTRKEAEDKCNEMNAKHSSTYWVEEKKI